MTAFPLFSVCPHVWGPSLPHSGSGMGVLISAVIPLSALQQLASLLVSYGFSPSHRTVLRPPGELHDHWVFLSEGTNQCKRFTLTVSPSPAFYFTLPAGSRCTCERSAPHFPPTRMAVQSPCSLGAGSAPTCRVGNSCPILSMVRVLRALRSAFQTCTG